MASPALLAVQGTPQSPAELERFVLLKDNSLESFNWSSWLRLAGAADFQPRHNLTISDSAQVVNMALAGQGIALARRSLVASELQNGTLRQLFEMVLPCPYAYYLLQSPHRASRPAVQCFVRWLQQAIAEDHLRRRGWLWLRSGGVSVLIAGAPLPVLRPTQLVVAAFMNAMPLMVVTAPFAKSQAVLRRIAAGGRIIPAVFGLDTVHS